MDKNINCFVYNFEGGVVSYFKPQSGRKASINEVKEESEVWEGRLHTIEGVFQFDPSVGDYIKTN